MKNFENYKVWGLFKTYEEYMRSKLWEIRRKEYLEGRKICELCNKKGNLQIHHKSYENLGNERRKELLFICSKCHHKIHEKK